MVFNKKSVFKDLLNSSRAVQNVKQILTKTSKTPQEAETETTVPTEDTDSIRKFMQSVSMPNTNHDTANESI